MTTANFADTPPAGIGATSDAGGEAGVSVWLRTLTLIRWVILTKSPWKRDYGAQPR